MMANKRNMMLESVAILFLVTRSDVTQARRGTSEANEHTYAAIRGIIREFTIEQLVQIVEKLNLKMEAIFNGNLATSRSNTGGSGYQQTFPDFINSLRAATIEVCPLVGPVEVDLDDIAVTQLWDDVASVIRSVNRFMKPFLKLFGVTEGNGLSPLAVDVKIPQDLAKPF